MLVAMLEDYELMGVFLFDRLKIGIFLRKEKGTEKDLYTFAK